MSGDDVEVVLSKERWIHTREVAKKLGRNPNFVLRGMKQLVVRKMAECQSSPDGRGFVWRLK